MTIDILVRADERVRRDELFAQVDGSLGPGATIWRVTAVGRADRRGLQTVRFASILVPLRSDRARLAVAPK
jgi:hypothetical protein